MNLDLSTLNKDQYEAVITIDNPLLIIAGAGSGKTGVITHRIAYMLQSGIAQSHILALTFTNKAAAEMQERIKDLTKSKLSNLTVATFHAFGLKILKEKASYLGWKNSFTIYDSSDQIEVIKEAGRELGSSYEREELKEIAIVFSLIKTRQTDWDSSNRFYKELYNEYNEFLKLRNAFDFDDLITKPVELFERYPEVLAEYQKRYHYIMVDEFQDTSLIQYEFIKLIALGKRNICVVGDDDQSIYSWRGANYKNIVNFEKDFPERKEIFLTQNYRSTGNILEAANSLISQNTNRKEKELWTHQKDNEAAIQLRLLEDDEAERECICKTIILLKTLEHKKFSDFGILVRTNSFMDKIEDALLMNKIPYTISGGSSFFERREVKDMIAYLKLMDNLDDDISLLRIINTPRRGIGKTALESIREFADKNKCSIYRSIETMIYGLNQTLSNNVKVSLMEFVELITKFKDKISYGKSMATVMSDFVEDINYWDFLLADCGSDKEAKWRYDNILKFVDMIDRWANNPDNLDPKLNNYLNRITLSNRDNDDENTDKVSLMTIHAAKGLEFPIVFLAGVENNIMPHARSIAEDPNNIEEERRLFYVAITRAKEKLYMTACVKRKSMTEVNSNDLSPFLNEIPSNLFETEEISDNKENSDAIADDLFKDFDV